MFFYVNKLEGNSGMSRKSIERIKRSTEGLECQQSQESRQKVAQQISE